MKIKNSLQEVRLQMLEVQAVTPVSNRNTRIYFLEYETLTPENGLLSKRTEYSPIRGLDGLGAFKNTSAYTKSILNVGSNVALDKHFNYL